MTGKSTEASDWLHCRRSGHRSGTHTDHPVQSRQTRETTLRHITKTPSVSSSRSLDLPAWPWPVRSGSRQCRQRGAAVLGGDLVGSDAGTGRSLTSWAPPDWRTERRTRDGVKAVTYNCVNQPFRKHIISGFTLFPPADNCEGQNGSDRQNQTSKYQNLSKKKKAQNHKATVKYSSRLQLKQF